MEKEDILLNSPKKKRKVIFFSLLGVIFVSLIVLIVLMHYEKCDSWECFNENLVKCKRTKFAGGTDTGIYGYTINGKIQDTCEVDVLLIQGELNNQESIALEGKSMTCYSSLGAIVYPESDLSKCHGELKESIQEQVILKLHNYIAQNLGQINSNIINPMDLISKNEN